MGSAFAQVYNAAIVFLFGYDFEKNEDATGRCRALPTTEKLNTVAKGLVATEFFKERTTLFYLVLPRCGIIRLKACGIPTNSQRKYGGDRIYRFFHGSLPLIDIFS